MKIKKVLSSRAGSFSACVFMPRKGFKSLTLPEDLYLRLQERAKLYGTTVQGIIKIALSDENSLLKEPSKSMVEGSNPSGPAMIYLLKQKN